MNENFNSFGEMEQNGFENTQFTPEQSDKPKKAKKSSKSGGKIVAVALCCSIFGGALGAGGTLAGLKYFGEKPQTVSADTSTEKDSSKEQSSTTIYSADRDTTLVNTNSVKTGELMTAAEVYAANVNSTVGITTSITTNYFGYQTTAAASGSGFIISNDGYILTNHHVIEDANEITVTTYDGNQYKAELVGSYSANDIAVLKIEAENLTPVILGSSDELNVGDSVIAIGNPLGELTFSLTSGVVSALNREVTTENGNMNLIQTDCAINSGNSGGALFNLYGEVVGITNAKYSSSSSGEASIDNIGFAIPINQIKEIVNSIIEHGYVLKPYIGVSVTDVSSEMTAYGLPAGAVVKQINENSPSEKAGLKENDIITKADDKEISNSNDLVNYVKSCSAGDKITLTVYRSGETVTLTLVIEEQKVETQQETQQTEQQPQTNDYGNYGFDFGNGRDNFFGYY